MKRVAAGLALVLALAAFSDGLAADAGAAEGGGVGPLDELVVAGEACLRAAKSRLYVLPASP